MVEHQSVGLGLGNGAGLSGLLVRTWEAFLISGPLFTNSGMMQTISPGKISVRCRVEKSGFIIFSFGDIFNSKLSRLPGIQIPALLTPFPTSLTLGSSFELFKAREAKRTKKEWKPLFFKAGVFPCFYT
jgi:hypothetical protein